MKTYFGFTVVELYCIAVAAAAALTVIFKSHP